MTRRSLISAAATLPLAAAGIPLSAAPSSGRLKQSVARWCYKNISLDDLCRQGAEMGLVGIDLIAHEEWPTAKKYGLTPCVSPGAGKIPDGWNRTENHARLEKEMQENLKLAAEAKVPTVITFSGNRKGLPDDQGKANCIVGLKRVKKMAEDAGVTVCMELLNSKIDHHDYQCDHSAWGIDVVKEVDSPRIKLLYDIYHMQIMEGDIIRTIRDNMKYFAHFHTGGVPGRHELDGTQELDWRAVATAIADLKYEGYFAHEFVPQRDPMKSLGEAIKLCTV